MTCIIGLRKDGVSYIASDRMSTASDRALSPNQPKIYPWGRFLLGVTGPQRINNVIEACPEEDRQQAGILDVVLKVRSLALADGFTAESGGGPGCHGTAMIAVAADGVWFICSAWGVSEIAEGRVVAAGSGAFYASGAAGALLRYLPPEDALREAVRMTCDFDVYCGGEPEVWRIDESGARVVERPGPKWELLPLPLPKISMQFASKAELRYFLEKDVYTSWMTWPERLKFFGLPEDFLGEEKPGA